MSLVNGCFNPNCVCLGSCIFLVGSQGLVFFNGPRVCPQLIVVLTQNQFVWAVAFYFLRS